MMMLRGDKQMAIKQAKVLSGKNKKINSKRYFFCIW